MTEQQWPLPGMKLIPGGVRGTRPLEAEIMTSAWMGCIHWAIGEPEVCERFEKETGLMLSRARNPIEAMVDKVCGFNPQASEGTLMAFMDWVTLNFWGVEGQEEKAEE
jgi:hypothetical protein